VRGGRDAVLEVYGEHVLVLKKRRVVPGEVGGRPSQRKRGKGRKRGRRKAARWVACGV
jgi:hypothetical protein